jgi:hypothetical protein
MLEGINVTSAQTVHTLGVGDVNSTLMEVIQVRDKIYLLT